MASPPALPSLGRAASLAPASASPRPVDLAGQLDPDAEGARYERGRRVGDGAFGDVYHGLERGTERHVAIKVLKERSDQLPASAADARLALLQEVYILRRVRELKNPNILTLLSAHEEPGSTRPGVPRIVHVTDFCAGGEVRCFRGLPWL